MGNGVEGDDKFNVPPERIREIVGEDKDHEGIVAGARMLMSQRADKALASREAPKVPALVVGTEEEFFLALARRRSDRTHVNTTMPRRIEFADGFKPHLKERDLSNLDLRNIDFGNAYLEGMVLRGCDLSGSSFYEANMKNVDLT